MAYEHMKVVETEFKTEKAIARIATSDFVVNPPKNVRDIHTYKTIPICDELWEFMEKLRKEIPSIEFGIPITIKGRDMNIGIDYFNPIRAVSEVTVYIPNDVYILGNIGYGDYCVTKVKYGKTRAPSYMVRSRTIENKKYSDHREHANNLLAKNLDAAIVNAKKHLRPYSPIEVAKAEIPSVVSSVSTLNDIFRRNAMDAQRALGVEGVVLQELRCLVESGYTFVMPKALELVTSALVASDAYAENKNKVVSGAFVSVSSQFGVQMIDVVHTKNLSSVNKADWVEENSIRYRLNEAPEHIMGRIAVLSMAEQEKYIVGVGSRLGDTIFWVQDDETTI